MLLLLLLTFIPHLVGEGEAPKVPVLWPAGQGMAWAPDSGAAVSVSNACPFLPGPSPPFPVLLGADCGPWLQGLINSGPAQHSEITGYEGIPEGPLSPINHNWLCFYNHHNTL